MKIPKDKIIKALEDKSVICWSDLLIKLDLLPVFERYYNENKKQYSIQQVFAGKTLLNWIEEILLARIVKSKDKRVKGYKSEYRKNLLYWDALLSMPVLAKDDIDYMLLVDL